jgi:hypothetical protein
MSMKAAAQASHMLDTIGYPTMSNFVTVDYSAASHIDKDTCPTAGQVLHRSQQVCLPSLSGHLVLTVSQLDRLSHNFFWTDFKLIVEMTTNMLWYWRADMEEHGTTVGEYVLSQSSAMSASQLRARLREGQITRVSTIPKAVASAHSRRQY